MMHRISRLALFSLTGMLVVQASKPFFGACPYATDRELAVMVNVDADNLASCDIFEMQTIMHDFITGELAFKVGTTPSLNETIVMIDICDDASPGRRNLRALQLFGYNYYGGGGCMSCGGDDGDGRRLAQEDSGSSPEDRILQVTLTPAESLELEMALSKSLTLDALELFSGNVSSCLHGDTTLTIAVSLVEAAAGSTFCD